MRKKAENKAIMPDSIVPNFKIENKYNFHGEGKFKPETIVAESLPKATEIYEQIKKPL